MNKNNSSTLDKLWSSSLTNFEELRNKMTNLIHGKDHTINYLRNYIKKQKGADGTKEQSSSDTEKIQQQNQLQQQAKTITSLQNHVHLLESDNATLKKKSGEFEQKYNTAITTVAALKKEIQQQKHQEQQKRKISLISSSSSSSSPNLVMVSPTQSQPKKQRPLSNNNSNNNDKDEGEISLTQLVQDLEDHIDPYTSKEEKHMSNLLMRNRKTLEQFLDSHLKNHQSPKRMLNIKNKIDIFQHKYTYPSGFIDLMHKMRLGGNAAAHSNSESRTYTREEVECWMIKFNQDKSEIKEQTQPLHSTKMTSIGKLRPPVPNVWQTSDHSQFTSSKTNIHHPLQPRHHHHQQQQKQHAMNMPRQQKFPENANTKQSPYDKPKVIQYGFEY